jgi:hypothetical protein
MATGDTVLDETSLAPHPEGLAVALAFADLDAADPIDLVARQHDLIRRAIGDALANRTVEGTSTR